MNVKTGTVPWMPRLSLDSLNKNRLAPELPNHWCCKPCLLSVLVFWFDQETSGNRKHIMKRLQQLLKPCLLPSPLSLGRLWGGTPKLYSEVPTFSYKKKTTGVPKVSMDWVCQHQNVWAPKQSEEPLQATGSWTSRHPGIVVSTLWKSTLCVLFLIFNLKLKSGASIQTSKATSPRELFSILRVWHSSKS